MNDDNPLLTLVLVFAPLSLLAIGGGASLLGDMQQEVVVHRGWLSAREFQDAFATSRVAPGPGMTIVTLIGWHVGGALGAILATAAIILPSSLLIYALAHFWHSGPPQKWQKALSRGLAPIAAGLILASALRLLSHADGQVVAWLVAAGIAAVALSSRVGQILLLGLGAVVFVCLRSLVVYFPI